MPATSRRRAPPPRRNSERKSDSASRRAHRRSSSPHRRMRSARRPVAEARRQPDASQHDSRRKGERQLRTRTHPRPTSHSTVVGVLVVAVLHRKVLWMKALNGFLFPSRAWNSFSSSQANGVSVMVSTKLSSLPAGGPTTGPANTSASDATTKDEDHCQRASQQ